MRQMIRTYSELIRLNTFEDRFKYLNLNGVVGADTFGFDRIFNQKFYSSKEWKKVRDEIIIRDNGCDLAIEGEMIYGSIVIHHMNPIRIQDVTNVTEFLLNPEYLICVSDRTHRAIHYGDEKSVNRKLTERSKNDTCPWKH